ncbi:pectinesterase/pectinesterase inhibitor ppe8b [Fagus crenata]
MSNFIVKDFQHFNVLSDCLELFDSTHELLDWSLTKFQDPNVTAFGTRNLKFDLQTWLSGVITNLATCNDELVGTNMSTILKDKIIMSLEKVTTLVNDQWAYVQQMPDDTVGHDFQSYFDSHDWKLMQADAISANITVASDGSGDFTSIMEAVKVAPNNSLARFVIYIKKATYKEYVSIPQNKWNIMMVGDGMDQTIISGSHSNTTGYGTYGSATFVVLSSSIPPQLEDLELSFNSLSGLVPADLRGLRNLKNMIIGKNSLGGSSDNLFATLLQL